VSDEPETLYTSSHAPDPASAVDVLAFILAPTKAFVRDESDRETVTHYLGIAKAEAAARWQALQSPKI